LGLINGGDGVRHYFNVLLLNEKKVFRKKRKDS